MLWSQTHWVWIPILTLTVWPWVSYLITPKLSFLIHKMRKIIEPNSENYKGLHIKPLKSFLAHSNHSISIGLFMLLALVILYQNSTVYYSCYWTLHFGSLLRFSGYFRKLLFLYLIYILLCWGSLIIPDDLKLQPNFCTHRFNQPG